MGYTIIIGNAKPEFSKDDERLYAAWVVESERSIFAPVFKNDYFAGINIFQLPYATWNGFCRRVGLDELFFNGDTGKLIYTFGCIPLIEEHYIAIHAAKQIKEMQAVYPPGYPERSFNDFKVGETPFDSDLALLMTLDFWVRHALDTAETPAIQNT